MRKRIRKKKEPQNIRTDLEKKIPQIVGSVTGEFALLTMKKPVIHAIEDSLRVMIPHTAKKLEEFTEIAKPFTNPDDPKLAEAGLTLINKLFAFSIKDMPTEMDPTDYVINEMEKLCKVPSDIIAPPELDYAYKHTELQNFINELVLSLDNSDLDNFIGYILSEHELLSQFQKVINRKLLPEGLKKRPIRARFQTYEKIKESLQSVTADWERLLTLLYGLIKLKNNKRRDFEQVLSDNLRNKVKAARKDSRLVPIAKEEWVTIRNALDHGKAHIIRQQRAIRFVDRKTTITWNIDRVYLEGNDMFLANVAMLYILNFINAASLRKRIGSLRTSANQKMR